MDSELVPFDANSLAEGLNSTGKFAWLLIMATLTLAKWLTSTPPLNQASTAVHLGQRDQASLINRAGPTV